jgi:hypothetical protein
LRDGQHLLSYFVPGIPSGIEDGERKLADLKSVLDLCAKIEDPATSAVSRFNLTSYGTIDLRQHA